jgi:hypothetical protein
MRAGIRPSPGAAAPILSLIGRGHDSSWRHLFARDLCRGYFSFSQFPHDFFDDTVGVEQNLVVPKTNDSVALSREYSGPRLIMARSLSMLAAVEFHNQTPLDAAEVRDEAFDRMLAAKLDAKLLGAQVSPQPPLGVGLFAPQFACKVPRRKSLHRV